jgi:hypothetical protein
VEKARHKIFARRVAQSYSETEAQDCDLLAIDDVLVSHGRLGTVRLDVRLRNTADETVNITRLNVAVLERHAMRGFAKPSAYYGFRLEGEHNLIEVAHVLKPGETDNFIVRVGFTKRNRSCHFSSRLLLYYNGSCVVESRTFEFSS